MHLFPVHTGRKFCGIWKGPVRGIEIRIITLVQLKSGYSILNKLLFVPACKYIAGLFRRKIRHQTVPHLIIPAVIQQLLIKRCSRIDKNMFPKIHVIPILVQGIHHFLMIGKQISPLIRTGIRV